MQHAFTLIELLAAIGSLVVFAAVPLPATALVRVSARCRRTHATRNVRNDGN